MYIILRFFSFNLQKIWQMAKKDFYCENNRCYYHFAAVLYVLCFCYCGHKNIHRSVLSFSHNTSNTMSRTYFTQYRVCKLTLNEVSYFFHKIKNLKTERTYDLIKENKVIFRLLPFNGTAPRRTCQRQHIFFASSRPPSIRTLLSLLLKISRNHTQKIRKNTV